MTSRPYVETVVFLGGISADVRMWVNRHPDENHPEVLATEGSFGPGGRAASAAVGAVRLGRRFVDLVGCVGDDMLGNVIVQSLKSEGVSVRLVDRMDSVQTGLRQVTLDGNGRRHSVEAPNANWHVGESQARRAESTILGADLLFATLEVPIDTVRRVVKTASARKLPVLLNAVPVSTATDIPLLSPTATGRSAAPAPAKAGGFASGAMVDEELLSLVDVLLLSWQGAQELAGSADDAGAMGVQLARRLLDKGAKAVVITLGEHGSLVATGGRHALVEPYAVRSIDLTGAGDAYAAALAVGLTDESRGQYRWEHLLRAARFASAAAAVSTTRLGGQSSLPTRDDVERLLTTQPTPAEMPGHVSTF